MTCAEDLGDPQTPSGFPTEHNVAATRSTIVPAALALKGWDIDESVEQVLQGELAVSSLDFVLHDRPMTIEGVLHTRGVTYLGTRKATRGSATIVNSQLVSTMSTGTLLFDADSGNGFSAGPLFIHIDQEAIYCDSLSGASFTANVDGRGAYNSLARFHIPDYVNGYRPRIWAAFPGFDGRRVSLWRIDTTSTGYVAKRRWFGYCSSPERTDIGYTLVCEHGIVTERARPIGSPAAAPRLRGYNCNLSYISLSWPGGPSGGLSTQDFVHNPASGRIVNSKQEFFDRIAAAMREKLDLPANAAWPGSITLAADGPNGEAHFYASIDSNTTLSGVLSIDGDQAVGTATQTSNPYSVSIVGGTPFPPVIVRVDGGDSSKTPITSIANLPASWTSTPYIDGSMRTQLTPVMRGVIEDGRWAVIEPSSVEDNVAGPTTTNPGAFLVGPARVETRVNEHNPRNMSLKTHVPVILTPQILCTSPHWLLAMRRGFVEDSTFANSGADRRDWDWTSQDDVIRATTSPYQGMQFYLDGTTSLDTTFRDRFKANACGIGIRNGKLSPFAFRAPLPTDAVVTSFTSVQFANKSKPVWKRLRNALCNVVEVDAGNNIKIVVRDQASAARYGFSAPTQVKLPDNEIYGGNPHDPFVIVGEILSRFISVFGQPVSTVAFTVGPSHADDAAIGDYVALTDWLSPDGTGAIGLNGTVGQVIHRTIPNEGGNGEASVTFTLLLYGIDGVAGFAPAIRAASLGTTTHTRDTIVAALNYLTSDATDYAGSGLLGYRYRSTFPNDGGVSYIPAGSKGRLFERNKTSPQTPEAVTVLTSTPSSIPGSSKLVFTAGVNVAWAAIATAGNLDFVPDVYSACTTAQKLFCYVADDTAPYPIGGTADTAKVFS